ncbi:GDP-mannose 4,6-dehydratase, partial [Luminiphilus sp.]|nr:GDP-mannose 4,6-dehydratase [Luminiphilus sp.]
EGAEVKLVDSMLAQYGGNLANISGFEDQVEVNYSDIRDTHSLSYLVRDVNVIYSMAGQTSHIDSMHDPFTDLDINCASQLSILECCRKYNPEAEMVFASTRQIYGRPQYLPVDEKHPICPVDVNGINKYAAEMYFKLYHEVYGLRCSSLRLTNTYGPRQYVRDDKYGFVGLFIRLALEGQPIKIFGDGKQLRDFNYIDDVVEAFVASTGNSQLHGGAYNLGHPEKHSVLEFVEALSKYANFSYEIVPFPKEREAIDVGDYYGSFELFSSLVGWKPKVGLAEGLRRTLEYFANHSHMYMPKSG